MNTQRGRIGSPSRRALFIACAVSLLVAGAVLFWILGAGNNFAAAAADDIAALSPERESALKAGDTFQECTNCPAMVVVPAGSFVMGSPPTEKYRVSDEGPQHTVTIAKPLAISMSELTFGEWDACLADGGCDKYQPSDEGWGRGRQPVINVTWNDAHSYVGWLSRKTGKPYRLLTEAEYEYAARAGIQTAYPWGNEIGKNHANCIDCGSQWDGNKPAPAGSFAPNRFGLHDMAGNVWEWLEDCVHSDYNGASKDGSAWVAENCDGRVVRGGSWFSTSQNLRSAARSGDAPANRSDILGIRVGRAIEH
jgi:formylglycine-generating enzyme required for sulfatase activity